MAEIDRQQALELLFLAWWHWAEPDSITGLSDAPEAVSLWRMIMDDFGGESSDDPEFLFVAGIMLGVTPWAFGKNDDANEKLADRMQARSAALRPQGFSPGYFDKTCEYGEYFAHHSRSANAS